MHVLYIYNYGYCVWQLWLYNNHIWLLYHSLTSNKEIVWVSSSVPWVAITNIIQWAMFLSKYSNVDLFSNVNKNSSSKIV